MSQKWRKSRTVIKKLAPHCGVANHPRCGPKSKTDYNQWWIKNLDPLLKMKLTGRDRRGQCRRQHCCMLGHCIDETKVKLVQALKIKLWYLQRPVNRFKAGLEAGH